MLATNRRTISTETIRGTAVVNMRDEDLGKIEDVMLNVVDGQVAYLVLSYGGLFGTTMADKRFAVPFSAFSVSHEENGAVKYRLNVSTEFLENAPGFDKDHYPDFADTTFTNTLSRYYGSVNASRVA